MDVLTTRLEKEEVESVDKLVEDLYELLPKKDLLDGLYSKRYRKQVWNIVQRMMKESPDYAKESCTTTSSNPISRIRKEICRLASWQKRLVEHEKEYGVEAWYDSISYPLTPSCISDLNAWRDRMGTPCEEQVKNELESRLDEVRYFGMWESKRPSDKKSPDVVSLLALGDTTPRLSRGEQRNVLNSDTFRSKYVFVFCISVPVLYDPDFQPLLNLCKELSVERADDCEMVMVADMNILADTERAFNRLFSLFPPSCLAVPYEDWDRRELIWKQLDCSVHLFECFVYDTNGLLLTNFSVNSDTIPYGAEAFPFTPKVKENVLKNRNQLRREGSLEDLLRPYGSSSPVEVYESPRQQQQQKRPISKVIKNKHVGLYVCCSGKLVPRLRMLYTRCKRKNQEFEIVVLYVPLPSELGPRIFQEKIESLLHEQNVRGWWCLPFNNSVSLRFWGLTEKYECSLGFYSNDWREDKLIIVGTGGKILDMYGAKMLDRFGHVYPFTREAVVKKKVEEVKRELPLKLLSGSKLFRGVDPSVTIDADEVFRSKKVIIFAGMAGQKKANGIDYGFDKLVSAYEDMKNSGEVFEVVFVELLPRYLSYWYADGEKSGGQEEKLFSDMPWYVYCHDDDKSDSLLAILLRKLFSAESLVGVGENGCIRSAISLVKHRGFCLDDTLEEDMYRLFLFTEFREI